MNLWLGKNGEPIEQTKTARKIERYNRVCAPIQVTRCNWSGSNASAPKQVEEPQPLNQIPAATSFRKPRFVGGPKQRLAYANAREDQRQMELTETERK